MSLHHARLVTKLLLLSSAGLLASGVIATAAYFGLRSAAATTDYLAQDAVPSFELIAQINDAVSNIRENQLNAVIARTADDIATEEKGLDESAREVDRLRKLYGARVDNDKERAAFDDIVRLYGLYRATAVSTIASAKALDPAKLEELQRFVRVDSGKAYDALGRGIDAMFAYNKAAVENAHAGAQAASHAAITSLAAITLCAGLALAALAWAITRALMRQLGGEPSAAAEVARAVAEGNLSMPIKVSAGDTTSVMASLKAMQESLGRTVLEVRRNAEGVATASAEIAQGNSDLSSRTEEQASALEETSASMEQLGATVKQNDDNARQANQLAQQASSVALEGGDVVTQVVDTMKGINDSSKRIADIIGVIDSIAFQTNILALNAAVEAARAGEQGRGFAVVASEVRNLAQRSADAAREIKSLISASVERVAHGSVLVDKAGLTMQEIVVSIRRVTDIMGEISAASTEQSAGVAQVSEAVTQMDQATQQNAALVEESAAAAESLSAQARQLVAAVAVFNVEHASSLEHGPRHGDARARFLRNAGAPALA